MESIPFWCRRQLERGQVWKDEAVQKLPLLGTQHEPLQIDGIAEERGRGKSHRVGLATRLGILSGMDFKGMEEWVRSRIDVRKRLDNCPVIVHENEGSDLVSVGRKQWYGAGRTLEADDYIQCGPFHAFEEGSHVGPAL